jgi:ABC-type phosphate transport system permease subunit
VSSAAERVFMTTARVCAITVVAIAPAVVVALVVATVGALMHGELAKGGDLLLALFGTTVIIGALSAAAGTAIGVSAALFAVEIASPRARQVIKALVGGLHAVPAVGFGLTAAGALLLAAQPPSALEVFVLAAMVLAVMLASVVFVQMRRELHRVPASVREAACAMGADSVQIVLRAVLPAIRRKIIAIWWATFGLALGEATALSMIFAAANARNIQLGTLASTLLRVGAADRVEIVSLAPTALVLFATSIAIIFIGRRSTGEVAWP